MWSVQQIRPWSLMVVKMEAGVFVCAYVRVWSIVKCIFILEPSLAVVACTELNVV